MLKEILSISGKPGLFKLVSQSKNMIIVESLIDGKRTPSYAHEKVISLSDIAMFTDSGEVPLREVFLKIQERGKDVKISVDTKAAPDVLRAFFAEILPDFDRERVYPSDIKKLITWYNLLIDANITDFSEPEAPITEDVDNTEETKDQAVKSLKTVEKKAKAAPKSTASKGSTSKAPAKKSTAAVKK